MGLLIDTRPFQYRRILTEAENPSGKFIVEGLMQVAGDSNGNGRIYPKNVLVREAQKFKDTYIKQGNPFGELDHPESPIVSVKNVSHAIIDLWWEGNNLMGRVEVLNTPFGNIVKEILKAGYVIGISSRGTGSLTDMPDGRSLVNDDFDLVTWDFVSNPSVQGAFHKQVSLNEGLMCKPVKDFSKVNEILNDILRG